MILTYGHGTDSAERTVATLHSAAVASVVERLRDDGLLVYDAGQDPLL